MINGSINGRKEIQVLALFINPKRIILINNRNQVRQAGSDNINADQAKSIIGKFVFRNCNFIPDQHPGQGFCTWEDYFFQVKSLGYSPLRSSHNLKYGGINQYKISKILTRDPTILGYIDIMTGRVISLTSHSPNSIYASPQHPGQAGRGQQTQDSGPNGIHFKKSDSVFISQIDKKYLEIPFILKPEYYSKSSGNQHDSSTVQGSFYPEKNIVKFLLPNEYLQFDFNDSFLKKKCVIGVIHPLSLKLIKRQNLEHKKMMNSGSSYLPKRYIYCHLSSKEHYGYLIDPLHFDKQICKILLKKRHYVGYLDPDLTFKFEKVAKDQDILFDDLNEVGAEIGFFDPHQERLYLYDGNETEKRKSSSQLVFGGYFDTSEPFRTSLLSMEKVIQNKKLLLKILEHKFFIAKILKNNCLEFLGSNYSKNPRAYAKMKHILEISSKFTSVICESEGNLIYSFWNRKRKGGSKVIDIQSIKRVKNKKSNIQKVS